MRLPYLQVSQEFLTAQAPEIAVRAKTDLATVIGAGILLFAHAVERTSTDETPPDGIFAEADAEEVLEGIMRWAGDPGRLIEAFVRARVIERLGLGVRVRGLDRYAKAWEEAEKARRRKERWREEQERQKNAFGTRSVSVPHASGTPINADADADAESTQKEPPPPAPEPRGKVVPMRTPRPEDEEADRLWEFMQSERAKLGRAREKRPKDFTRWAGEALAEVGPRRLSGSYSRFLLDPDFERSGWPMPVFMSPGVWRPRANEVRDTS